MWQVKNKILNTEIHISGAEGLKKAPLNFSKNTAYAYWGRKTLQIY
jgi:hypothetical protein